MFFLHFYYFDLNTFYINIKFECKNKISYYQKHKNKIISNELSDNLKETLDYFPPVLGVTCSHTDKHYKQMSLK